MDSDTYGVNLAQTRCLWTFWTALNIIFLLSDFMEIKLIKYDILNCFWVPKYTESYPNNGKYPTYSKILLQRPPPIPDHSSHFLLVIVLFIKEPPLLLPKVVLKSFETTFEQSQMWSRYGNFTVHVHHPFKCVKRKSLQK